MAPDLERRRRAIVRALRATTSPEPTPHLVTPADVAALNANLAELARRVERIAGHVELLNSTPLQVPETDEVDPEEPVNRVSVPPLLPSRLGDHAFDVLLGTAAASDERAQSHG